MVRGFGSTSFWIVFSSHIFFCACCHKFLTFRDTGATRCPQLPPSCLYCHNANLIAFVRIHLIYDTPVTLFHK